ncbi:DUF6807 family protein [Streptomyces antibioticus]|uniref:DUF6807 family protein n=1 Tax=Streptomyces antibioticus TaxID=1890 RepID=UPI0033F0A3AA
MTAPAQGFGARRTRGVRTVDRAGGWRLLCCRLEKALAAARELAPGDTLTRRWRVIVADGAWAREEIAAYLESHPW